MQTCGDFFGCSFSNDFAPTVSALGAKVDDPVSAFDHIEIVFDYDQGSAAIDQLAKRGQKIL